MKKNISEDSLIGKKNEDEGFINRKEMKPIYRTTNQEKEKEESNDRISPINSNASIYQNKLNFFYKTFLF